MLSVSDKSESVNEHTIQINEKNKIPYSGASPEVPHELIRQSANFSILAPGAQFARH